MRVSFTIHSQAAAQKVYAKTTWLQLQILHGYANDVKSLQSAHPKYFGILCLGQRLFCGCESFTDAVGIFIDSY